VPLVDLFAELMGRDSPLCGGRGGSAYLSSAAHGLLGENSIVGAGVPIALGAALAAALDREGAVSLAVIGDGALNQGSVHEALNFAAVMDLPLVVVVENNVYSEMTPIRDMARVERLSDRAAGYGIPGTTVDGRATAPVEAVVAEAVARARAGHGPSLIEAMCDRLVGHYTGDVQQYRPHGDLDRAAEAEPLAGLRREHRHLAGEFDRLDGEVEETLSIAIEAAKLVPPADPATAREHLHAG
jgi:TPP-dependent pyruvate/acetoin dehydrogenase alpha subunit